GPGGRHVLVVLIDDALHRVAVQVDHLVVLDIADFAVDGVVVPAQGAVTDVGVGDGLGDLMGSGLGDAVEVRQERDAPVVDRAARVGQDGVADGAAVRACESPVVAAEIIHAVAASGGVVDDDVRLYEEDVNDGGYGRM